jgi:hypothetical protein
MIRYVHAAEASYSTKTLETLSKSCMVSNRRKTDRKVRVGRSIGNIIPSETDTASLCSWEQKKACPVKSTEAVEI